MTGVPNRGEGRKPRLLDLYCKAGGSSMGYHRAGWGVTGVDREPQPNYPFPFVQGSAIDYAIEHGAEFDLISASPPCQAFSAAQVIHGREHPDYLTPTRAVLEFIGVPWVIENVPRAPMRVDLVLCGTAFPELRVRRHRWFEFSDPSMAPALVHGCDHSRSTVPVFGHGGHIYHGVEDWKDAMQIDWMTRDELAQAIPPAYTELIGHQLLQHLRMEAVA